MNSAAGFEGKQEKLKHTLWPQLVAALQGTLGANESGTRLKLIDGTYHVVGCSSPEYNCYAPFGSRMCQTKQDCNYEISQLRWGLATVLELMDADPTLADAACDGRGPCSSAPQRCSNASRTWCPSDPSPNQCDQPSRPACPACPSKSAHPCAVDFGWWRKLLGGALAWYPYDNVTGFRLDTNCAFECP